MTTASHRLPLLAALLLAFLGTSCQHVNHLRDAQQSFNAAAQLENQTRLQTENAELERQLQQDPGQALASLASVQSGYGAALHSLRQANTAKLRQDKLLGVALTLEALAEWRLGQYDAALATKDRAESEASDQIYPRDAATLAALPGLIKTDLAYAQILRMGADTAANETLLVTQIKPRLVDSQGAVSDLQAARNRIEPDHPMQVYLIQCQLAAYRNYQVAHQKARGSSPALTDPAHRIAQTNLTDLRTVLDRLDLKPLGDKMITFWGQYNIRPLP